MLMECELIFDGSTLSGSIFISRRRVKYLFMEIAEELAGFAIHRNELCLKMHFQLPALLAFD